ncbi:MAG: NAD(P)-binding domain-containing protein, partial [Actinobacteria bacterium]|nr:NAD(P)-binding domain-containing protein [Actinomycetota bacterium]
VERRAELARDLRERAEGPGRWVLLETCHRVEAYGVGEPPGVAGESDMRLLRGEAAVRHLFRVACGMESAVVGEDEVLHQVRDALASTRDAGLDPRLTRLFESAIAAGRSARSVPAPPRRSLAERAVAWLGERAGQGPLMVVGTGPMGSALARAAEAAGSKVVLASRTPERAHVDLAVAARLAPQCAAVAVALGGEWRELAGHSGPLPPIADLSSPSAVPLSVRSGLDGGFLGIDGLWERGAGEADWQQPEWKDRAEQVVAEGVAEYLDWLLGRGSLDALVALKERAEQRRRARVEKLLRRLPDLSQRERELVEQMSRQLVTDLLHEPVSELRSDRDGSRRDAA